MSESYVLLLLNFQQLCPDHPMYLDTKNLLQLKIYQPEYELVEVEPNTEGPAMLWSCFATE